MVTIGAAMQAEIPSGMCMPRGAVQQQGRRSGMVVLVVLVEGYIPGSVKAIAG